VKDADEAIGQPAQSAAMAMAAGVELVAGRVAVRTLLARLGRLIRETLRRLRCLPRPPRDLLPDVELALWVLEAEAVAVMEPKTWPGAVTRIAELACEGWGPALRGCPSLP
jgi:hypothetical protein